MAFYFLVILYANHMAFTGIAIFLNIICNISGTINLKQPLYLLSLIIASDVGGYLIGKSVGQFKIFPKTSPNKTFEGALGGVLACLLVWGLFFYSFTESVIIEIIARRR